MENRISKSRGKKERDGWGMDAGRESERERECKRGREEKRREFPLHARNPVSIHHCNTLLFISLSIIYLYLSEQKRRDRKISDGQGREWWTEVPDPAFQFFFGFLSRDS